ncbi:hypothetical protein MMC07_003660 [Pseudocyphellaria aurata]|nr:hypothetical protein [Pseudocyphellaria aurata]
MSFVTRSVPRWTLSRATIVLPASRQFHITSLRSALSESDHSRHESEDRSGEIERHKNDQLQKQKDGKGHWKQELSSNSEAALKADREKVKSAEEDIAKLQKETAETANSRQK